MEIKNIFKYALGGLIVIGFFTFGICLVIVDIPQKNTDLLNLVVGSLLAAFATVVAYFYGSSLGSSEKNKMLMEQKEKNAV
jgi:hypothetical protein